MTTVTAKFVDHNGNLLGPDAKLSVWAPELTPVSNAVTKVSVVEKPSEHNISTGVPVPPLENLVGGPMVFLVDSGRYQRRYHVTIPTAGTVDFADLIAETNQGVSP